MRLQKYFYPFLFILVTGIATELPGQVKIGDNTQSIDPSAVLELEKTDMGLLITRIALTDAADNTTIPSPANSLLIYNTASAGSGSDIVSPGFYYWDSNQGRWKGLLTSAGPTGDVWIDAFGNILSVNSGNQALTGSDNIALGLGAFGDLGGASNYVIAIGRDACNSETTSGDANVAAIGLNAAFGNSGTNLNALGVNAAFSNTGINVNAMGAFSASVNSGYDVNAFGGNAAANNTNNGVNAFGNAAAINNIGFEINAFGPGSCADNVGDVVNAMGWQSAKTNAGNDVNAFGVRAAQNNGVDGDNLNAMGLEAGQNNIGWDLNAFGEGAGRNNSGGLVNALGTAAGENNSGWSANMFGSQAGQFNTGSELNAMGAMAAQYNTHANVNAFGLIAAQYNQNEGVNALGFRAAQYNTGYQVNAIGASAARFNSADHTIAIGESAVYGDSLTFEGTGTIGIGYSAASNVGTGNHNICIGYDADITDPSANDQINIGNQIVREADGMIRLKDFITLTPLDAPPSTTEEGTLYYSATDHKLFIMTNEGWKEINMTE